MILEVADFPTDKSICPERKRHGFSSPFFSTENAFFGGFRGFPWIYTRKKISGRNSSQEVIHLY